MKITLDKNFLFVQFILVIVFYIINNFLAMNGVIKYRSKQSKNSKNSNNSKKSKSVNSKYMNKHFECSKPISSDCVMLYVLSNQFGVPNSKLLPKSRETKLVATVQRVIFIAMSFGALTYDKNVCNLFN